MAVWIAGAGRRHGDPRSYGVHESLGGSGPAAVMRDLEQIDPWQTGGQERRVDRLLHVAHQQETAGPDLP
jgi:hypothetical protein